MREWTQLEDKYNQLEKSDPKGAQTLKYKQLYFQVMREWTQLEDKYNQLEKSDPKGAQTLKSELTEQFEVIPQNKKWNVKSKQNHRYLLVI